MFTTLLRFLWGCKVVLAIASVAGLLGQPLFAQPAAEGKLSEGDLHSLYYSVYLPTDRQLTGDLEYAEQLFEQGRYAEGIPLIERVLTTAEDLFDYRLRRDSTVIVQGLKYQTQQRLLSLPREGRQALELELGAVAHRRLQQALRSANVEQMAAVAARYPVTAAATDALLVVAQYYRDRGDFAAAARAYEKTLEWLSKDDPRRPILSLWGAICWARGGESDALETALQSWPSWTPTLSEPQRTELWGGQTAAQVAEQLRELAHQAANRAGETEADAGWLVEGGAAARHRNCTGGLPHSWSAWQARTVQDARLAQRLENHAQWQQGHGGPWPLVASPLAVGNLVIARTPQNVVAIDWGTGKRIWETRPQVPEEEHELQVRQSQQGKSTVVPLDVLEQRIWLDAVYGAVSSDGRRVFAIRNLAELDPSAVSRWGRLVRGQAAGESLSAGNSLAAYELESEGKLIWQRSGQLEEGSLRGIFFLGPPLAIDQTLYVLAELDHSVSLVALQADTGELLWKQPLVHLERSVWSAPVRRLAGATPAYRGGLLVCSTGAGSVVVYDLIDQTLRWVYRCPVDESQTNAPDAARRQPDVDKTPAPADQWSRNRALIAEDCVVVATPESEQLHCLALETGELRWRIPRGDALFVAGVAEGKVLTVGSRSIRAVQLADGKPAWEVSPRAFPTEASVAGQGMIVDQQLLLPLTNQQMLAVRVESGLVDQLVSIRQDAPLGNLAFHRGSLLTQSTTGMARFDQLDRLRQRVAAGQGTDSPDPQLLRIQGEILWGEGELHQAIALFQQAYAMQPEEELLQGRLREALLAGLQADYDRYREQSDLLARLLEDRPQRWDLVRIHLDAAVAEGDYPTALDYLLELYTANREELVQLSTEHIVLEDRYFAARLAQLWEQGEDPLRSRIQREMDPRYQQALQQPGVQSLARFVRYFGGIPAARPMRWELVDQWMDQGRWAEAELLLLKQDDTVPGAREAEQVDANREREMLWARLGEQEGIPVATRSADGQGAFAADRWPADERWHPGYWPAGKVLVDHQRMETTTEQRRRRSGSEREERCLIPTQLTGPVSWGPTMLAMEEGRPQLLGWNSLGEISHRINVGVGGRGSRNKGFSCFRFGHFCAIRTDTAYSLVDFRKNQSPELQPILWSSLEEAERQMASDQGSVDGQRWRRFDSNPLSQRLGLGESDELLLATPRGVVIRSDMGLGCYSLLDGELLWLRKDLSESDRALASECLLFVLGEGQQEGTVLSMIDGRTMGRWKKPVGKWLATDGGQVATSRLVGGEREIAVVHVVTGEVRLRRRYDVEAEWTFVAPELLLVCDPAGKLEAIDIRAGEVRFVQQLLPEPKLQSLHALLSGEQLFVAMNTSEVASFSMVESSSAPIITGRVYALDAVTGQATWSQPATVRGQGLLLMQPSALPTLLFVGKVKGRLHQQGSHTVYQNEVGTRVLALDKRTGRSVVREDELPELEERPWAVRGELGGDPKVILDLGHTLLTLHYTDQPFAPQPVAQAEVEMQTGEPPSAGDGLWDLTRRMLRGAAELSE